MYEHECMECSKARIYPRYTHGNVFYAKLLTRPALTIGYKKTLDEPQEIFLNVLKSEHPMRNTQAVFCSGYAQQANALSLPVHDIMQRE